MADLIKVIHLGNIGPHSEILIFKVEPEPSAITKTPSEIHHTFSRVVSVSQASKLKDKIARKSNRFATRGYIAEPPNYRSQGQPSPYETIQNAHQSAKPSMSPHDRFERRAHYHHRRGQQHLKYHRPLVKTTRSQQTNNSNSNTSLRANFGCLNRIIAKKFISAEEAITQIWNQLIDNTGITENTPQISLDSDSPSVAPITIMNDNTPIDNTLTSTTIMNSNSPIENTITSTDIINSNSPIDNTITSTTIMNSNSPIDNNITSSTHTIPQPILTTTAQNKLLDLILHPHNVHIRKQYPHYEIKKKYYMPVLVVADKSFMHFHRKTDYDTYILTVVNMASELLHDLTLGVSVELTIARTIYLEDDSRQFQVDCEITSYLENFCRWTQRINPRDATHPSHHDVAILVTRYYRKGNNKCVKWCDKLGASHSGDVCVPGKSCVVVRDTGLSLGITIAQQLGFLLGAPLDDGLDGHCPPETSGNTTVFQHVMAPTPRHGAMVWSQCSRKAVVSFFSQGLRTCLEDEPPKTVLTFPGILPGVMYDANYQCSLAIPGSKACYLGSVQFCSKLYCQRRTKACVYKGHGPAQGTPCGSYKWCFNEECVHSGERPGSVSGGWGSWQSWGACSRTCGGGVRRARRSCDSPAPTAGGRYCAGEAIRHHTCNTQPCNITERSFRAVQCSAFDDVVISGKQHRWSPLVALPQDTCGLYCTTEKGLKVRLRPRVIDGTPCRNRTNDLCIDGVCTRVGCDWVIGSNTISDRCGACGGDGSHCHLVQGWYNTTHDKNIGFKSITVIPKGSRKINIYEACLSANNLALCSVPLLNEKEEFFVIGNSSEVEFLIKSTVGIYTHVEPRMDMILIEGPLPVNVRVLVNIKGQLSPIHYSYMDVHIVDHTEYVVTEATLKRSQRNPFIERNNPLHWNRYQWEHLDWSRCSARCEVGTSLCTPHCVSFWFGRVSDSYCDPGKKPQPRVRVCNERPCAVSWRTGPWVSSHNSMQWRVVQCVREARSYLSAYTVVNARCCDGMPPPSVGPCKIGNQTKGSSVTNQRELFELNKIEPNYSPPTTQYYIAGLDPAKRSTSRELTDSSYIKKRNHIKTALQTCNKSQKSSTYAILKHLHQRNYQRSMHETTIASRTKEMQQSAKVESSYYSLPYQEGGETTGDDIQTVLFHNSTTSTLEAQSHLPKLINSAILDLFNTGHSNRTDDLDIILLNNNLTTNLSKHEQGEKFDIEMTDKVVQIRSTDALSTHSIDYVTPKTPKLISLNSKRKIFKKRKPRLLELKNILFSRSKNKREISKHAEVLQHTNCTNTLKCSTAIAKLKNDNRNSTFVESRNSTYLVIKLANGIITKINHIFNNTDKIYVIFRDIKPEIMRGKDKVFNTHNMLNSSSSKEICVSTNQRKTKYIKKYLKDDPYSDLKNKFGNMNDLGSFNVVAKIPSSNHFTEEPIDFRSKIQHSNEFVTKMPLKIFKSIVTVDGFKSKLANEHNSNVINQLDWLRNITTAMIVPKCSVPSTNKNNSEKMYLPSLRKHTINAERVLRDCFRNMSKNVEETHIMNLDVKGSGVTIQSLYNVINIYCGDCKYNHINGSNNVISVFNDSNVNNRSIEDFMDEYATSESAHQEYVENSTEALCSSTKDPSFVEITLIPFASKRKRGNFKLFRKYKRLFGNKHVLNNNNSINPLPPT